jgi:hypothetical protein
VEALTWGTLLRVAIDEGFEAPRKKTVLEKSLGRTNEGRRFVEDTGRRVTEEEVKRKVCCRVLAAGHQRRKARAWGVGAQEQEDEEGEEAEG